MIRVIVNTVHEIDGEAEVEWVLERLFLGNITKSEIKLLREKGEFSMQDRIPHRGVTLKTTVKLERIIG
jgi:hypothetical protein